MAARKPKQAKAVVPPREDKAVRPAAANKAAGGFLRVRVVKAHDGLEAGTVLSRPQRIAQEMINLGFW
ncbi:MAG: hypothetical protein J6T35_06005, partial [Bacteroidales bacterium]|nr:hypothetical protein [Bacteroidales bacterium]